MIDHNHNNLGIIIFSRISSSRLPRKALKKINGRELILRAYDSCKHLKKKIPIIIATSDNDEDEVIARLASQNNIKIFRGSLNNVLKRAYEVCIEFKLTHFVRFCGDRPLYPKSLIDLIISSFKDGSIDLLSSNLSENKLPPGLTSELISKRSIKYILNNTDNPYHLEHITSFIYQNKNKFNIASLENIPNIDWGNKKFVVDTYEDLIKINCISEKVDSNFLSYNLTKSLQSLYLNHKYCSKLID